MADNLDPSVENLAEYTDVDMAGAEVVEVVEADTGANTITVDEAVTVEGTEVGAVDDNLPPIEQEKTPSRITFLDYFQSPIIQLSVGVGDNVTILNAHQALLVRSPFFAEACAKFSDDDTVSHKLCAHVCAKTNCLCTEKNNRASKREPRCDWLFP